MARARAETGQIGAEGWERWVRAPRQQRARDTFTRVLDAGAALLAESGYAGFSMAEVCQRAAIAPGTLYGRVDGKDLLFLAIHDRELERMLVAPLAGYVDGPRWSRLRTPELVEEVVRVHGEHYAAERDLLRVFILRAAVDERVRVEGAAKAARLEQAVVALLGTRSGDYPHADADSAVRAAYRIVTDSLSWRTAFGSDFPSAGAETAEEWVERLQAVCRTYLLTPPSSQ